MQMSGESLLIVLVVGLIAGWLAGQIVQGTGFGIIGDLLVGVVGAFIGSWLLPQLGVHLGAGSSRGRPANEGSAVQKGTGAQRLDAVGDASLCPRLL